MKNIHAKGYFFQKNPINRNFMFIFAHYITYNNIYKY